jgi:hypothetical protein
LSLLWNSNTIRTIGHTIHKKEPITPEILKQIATKYGTTSSNLKDLRLVTMCLTSPSISQIEKWLKIVLTNEKLIKIIHSILKLTR